MSDRSVRVGAGVCGLGALVLGVASFAVHPNWFGSTSALAGLLLLVVAVRGRL